MTVKDTGMLQQLKDAGFVIPELEEGYVAPSGSRAIGRHAQFKSVDSELADKLAAQGYYQCSRCGRVLGTDHYTKNKRACRTCNGLASQASHARVRGLAWSTPDDSDDALKAAHPAFESDEERAKEWAVRVSQAEAEAEAQANAEAAAATE